MCIALQSLRLTPSVIKSVRLAEILPILHSAVSSEMAPILIMERMTPEVKAAKRSSLSEETAIRHAVTVTGLRFPWFHSNDTNLPRAFKEEPFFQPGHLIRGFYLHDDRRGPYTTSELLTNQPNSELLLRIGRKNDGQETWFVEKLLIPMYPRINLSFTELHDLGLSAIILTQVLDNEQTRNAAKWRKPRLECRFIRGHRYVESCLFNGQGLNSRQIAALCERLALPRYAGLITVTSDVFGQADVLIDSTTTGKNQQALAVVPRSPIKRGNENFCRCLAKHFDTEPLAC